MTVLYLVSVGAFLIGLRSFLFARHQIEVASFALQVFEFIRRFAGWTLYGFLPLATILAFLTIGRIVGGPLSEKAKHVCALLEVVAYALGIMGPITHHIFKGDAASVVGEGFGSLAVGILCWVWSVLLCFDFQHLRPATDAAPQPVISGHE